MENNIDKLLKNFKYSGLYNNEPKFNLLIGKLISDTPLKSAYELIEELFISKAALEWWNSLPMYNMDKPCKRNLSNKYFAKEPGSLTEEQIIQLYLIDKGLLKYIGIVVNITIFDDEQNIIKHCWESKSSNEKNYLITQFCQQANFYPMILF